MKNRHLIILLPLMIAGLAFGQSPITRSDLEEKQQCISATQYAAMESEISRNKAMLGLDRPYSNARTGANIKLEWPLKASAGLLDYNYFYISAFVDQNKTAGAVKDWNCGTRTYDGHRGVDIVPWPFIWDKMDNNLVQVIAAAPGIIVAKVDGNADRVCNGVGGGSNSNNYITIQHADGSQALYVHLKTGSMTSKGVGQSVTTGEFLGTPGSAGQSGGVHLHFEIRSDGTFANYIDPFLGTCNTAITSSWWTNQRAYREPEVVRVSVHDNWPYAAVCPLTKDTVHQVTSFPSKANAQGIFAAYTKDIAAGLIWNFKILNPDGSTFKAWDFTNLSDRNTSSLEWPQTLPEAAGTYLFQVTFNGKSYSTPFEILANKSAQSITFGPLAARTFGDASFQLTGTASSGLPVKYVSSNPGVASITGNSVTITGAGTTNIIASQPGDGSHLAAPDIIQPFTVSKATQIITFNPLMPRNSADPPFALVAASNSTLPISFTSSDPGVATISGNQVTIMGVGITQVTAAQAGNSNYLPASNVVQALMVNTKSNQSITFPVVPDRTLGDLAFTLSATSTSNLQVLYTAMSDKISITGNQVALLKAGRAAITASQPGDANTNPANPIERTFCIKPPKPTITLTDSNTASPTLTSNASSGNQWYYNRILITGATQATLVASKAGVYNVRTIIDDCPGEMSSDQVLLVTGLEDSHEQTAIRLYPNPAEDQLTISFGSLSEKKEITLLQIHGVQMDQIETTETQVTFSVASLSPGIYLARVKTGSSVHVIRFIKF
jgi:murein DD-endopeptidase MepM/ murein hydrolase activator NlpD